MKTVPPGEGRPTPGEPKALHPIHKDKAPDLNKVRREFHYEPTTGSLYRLVGSFRAARRTTKVGVEKAYRCVSFDNKSYLCHRIIWFLMTGEWPFGYFIDHVNGDGMDNRWCNLRLATKQQNAANVAQFSRTKSGLKGVYPTERGTWGARIKLNGKTISLGRYPTKEEAAEAYRAAALDLFGEFANDNHQSPK